MSVVDLFLDTRHYGAHTVAADALWVGVPVSEGGLGSVRFSEVPFREVP